METITRGQWQGHEGLLSRREIEFTLGVAAGKTDKEMAREAGLAPDSVRKRVYSAMFKLGVNRRGMLIAEAMRRQLISHLVLTLMLSIIAVSASDTKPLERAHRVVRIQRGGQRGGRRDDFLDNTFEV